jgi:cation diffusion facilitator family transporter
MTVVATIAEQTEHLEMQREKRRVALNSVYAAAFITIAKIIVGATTHSLGIMSEAAHSGLDFLAAIVTFLSVRVSDRPADADHQYGHGKVENFSAFLETGLLLLTCIWIVYEAVKRLAFKEVHVEPTPWAFLVMFASMTVDVWRSRRLRRIADKYQSQALEADALHFSTDVWSSAVVILGLALAWIGERQAIPLLERADPIAALIVAGVVVYVSWRLARQTIDALLDAAPAGARASILSRVSAVAGVVEVDRVRIRRAGNQYFADLEVGISPRATFQRSEEIAGDVRRAVHQALPGADVVVRSVPRSGGEESIFDRIRSVASRNNFNIHDVSVQDLQGKIHVELHLELDEQLTLVQAHEVVTELESKIREEVPEVSSILTHIESEPSTIETADAIIRNTQLEKELRVIVKEFPEVLDVHDFVFKRVRGHLYLSCHCTMSDDLPLSKVHDTSTALEIRFKLKEPKLFKVLIHTEPETDNRR